MKICSLLLLVRKMQIKTTHFSTIRLVKIQNFDNILYYADIIFNSKIRYNLNPRGLALLWTYQQNEESLSI